LKELHPANAQERQQDDGHNDNANAAHPLHDRPPDEQPWRQTIQAGQNSGASRGKPGDCLKYGVCIADPEPKEGQGSKCR
jgi:hypothetical protein